MSDFASDADVRTLLVVGSGLVGTSAALALRDVGWSVFLTDRDPDIAEHAARLGAGLASLPDDDPDIILFAVPPQFVAPAASEWGARYVTSTLVDVASVKELPLRSLRAAGVDLARVVGSHPMAGREVSGPANARADLFADRVWVITPLAESDPARVQLVQDMAVATGAVPVVLPPGDHDRAVALTSHTPQLLASITAARLAEAEPQLVAISGQGVRDVTRIAASDPDLWTDILESNADHVADVLAAVAEDLERAVVALRTLASTEGDQDAARATVHDVLSRGRTGRAALPGKHGAEQTPYEVVSVVIPDRPGALAELFAVAGTADVSVEDLRIDHALGRQSAVVEISVRPEAAQSLSAALTAGGWVLRG
jgi:prephenate dehydrogenase